MINSIKYMILNILIFFNTLANVNSPGVRRDVFGVRDGEVTCEEVVQREGMSVGCPDTEDEILQTGWRHWGELSLSRTAVPLCHCHVLGCVSPFWLSNVIRDC